MKLYRTLCHVLDSTGAIVGPGGEATLDDDAAAAMIAARAVDPEPIRDGVEISGPERLGAILALVPKLQDGDFTQAGQLRAEARRRLAVELGFEPDDEEINAAGEAYAKALPAGA